MNNESSFDIIQESNPVQTVAPTKEDNDMLRATEKITALYCRLSVEDTKDEKKNGKRIRRTPFSTNRLCSCSMPKPTVCRTRPTLLTMVTVVLPTTAPVFRKCSLKSKPVMWVRLSPKTFQGLVETPH